MHGSEYIAINRYMVVDFQRGGKRLGALFPRCKRIFNGKEAVHWISTCICQRSDRTTTIRQVVDQVYPDVNCPGERDDCNKENNLSSFLNFWLL